MVRYLLAAAAVAALVSGTTLAQAEDFGATGTTKIITRSHDGMGGKKVVIKRHGNGMVTKKKIIRHEGFGSSMPDRMIVKRRTIVR